MNDKEHLAAALEMLRTLQHCGEDGSCPVCVHTHINAGDVDNCHYSGCALDALLDGPTHRRDVQRGHLFNEFNATHKAPLPESPPKRPV